MPKTLRLIIPLTIFSLLLLHPPNIFASDYHHSVWKHKLPNELTVILEEDNTTELVNIGLWIRAGSVYEGKYLGSGISHLVEHMVFKGSESKNALELAQKLQALGGQLNGATGMEYTNYRITVPKENLIKVMELVYHVLSKAEFSEDELAKEKEVIIHEMAGIEDNPKKHLARQFWNTSFQGHPYGVPVIGNRLIFDTITRDDLIEYYRSKYIPSNIILVITGNFSSDTLKPVIEKIWGNGIPAKPLDIETIPLAPSVQGPLKKIIQKPVSNSYILMGFLGPSIASPDMYPMDVMAEVMGSGKQSRLIKKLRDRLGLVSSITAWSYTPTYTGVWGVSADSVTSDWRLVQKQVLKELYKLKLIPVTEKELRKAKKRIIRTTLSSLETIDGKTADIGINEIYTHNPLFTSTYINGIKKVTAQDIQQAARKYLKPALYTICVLEPQIEEALYKKPVLMEKDVGVTRLELDNGIRVLIKEDNKLPLVTIRLAALGGLLEEDKPGLSHFFSQLWLKSNPDLVKKIEDNGGGISIYSGNNSFGCTIEVLEQDILLALNVLGELINRLPIDTKKIELTKKLQLAEIEQEQDRPYTYSFKLTKNIFFGEKHPYRNSTIGTLDSVSGITEKDILTFKKKSLVPENMVLVISGMVNTNQLIPITKKTFGNIPATEFISRKQFPAIPVEANKHQEFKDTEDTIIILAYPGTSIYSEDRYSLELLEQLFTGLASRLFGSIREDKALSYSVGALNFMGRQPGTFAFYIATETSNVDEAIETLKQEISKIKTEPISGEELQRIKTHVLTQLQEHLESKSGYSLEIALSELYGLGWNNYLKHLESIKNVTAEDIKRVANKYFRDDWNTLVVVGPVENADDR